MRGDIFSHLDDSLINIAIVSLQPGVSKKVAAEALISLSPIIGDIFTANRLVNSMPRRIKISKESMEEIKNYFEIRSYFHYEKILGTRSVWVTTSDPDMQLGTYWTWARRLMASSFDEMTAGSTIYLKNGVAITFDRRP